MACPRSDSSMKAPSDSCWVIHDGAAGNRRQALALAQAMALDYREWSLQPGTLARWCAPRLFPAAHTTFGKEFAAALAASSPALSIGCGRIAALATRLTRASGAYSIQILDPRLSPQHWDLVIVPEHDRMRGDNVLTLLGSLHPVDAQWLARARGDFASLENLPAPRTAVLLGGPTRATPLDQQFIHELLDTLQAESVGGGGSLMLVGSSRTPATWSALLRERLAGQTAMLWLDDRDGPNPYPGVLGWADRIVVSPDSVNMVSEACATEAPVRIAGFERATGRVAAFLQSLQQRGRIRHLHAGNWNFVGTPLIETGRIAAAAIERLSRR